MELAAAVLKQNKINLESKIKDLLVEFEEKNGQDIISDIYVERHNGSNSTSGKIVSVGIKILI